MIICEKCGSSEVVIMTSDYQGDDMKLGHDSAKCPNCGTLDLTEVKVK